MERMDRLMDDMMRKAVEMPKAQEGASPFVYGFSMSVGPDGKPVIREFGNVEPGARGPLVKEEREPLVDVMDNGKEVVVVTELPGVEKDEIKLESTDRASRFRAQNGTVDRFPNRRLSIEISVKISRSRNRLPRFAIGACSERFLGRLRYLFYSEK